MANKDDVKKVLSYVKPLSAAITLGWASLAYSLKPGKKGNNSYGTIRKLQSALFFYTSWQLHKLYSKRVLRDHSGRSIIHPYVTPSDKQITTITQSGMKKRLGSTSSPRYCALQYIHVRYINDYLEHAYQSTDDIEERHNLACAGTANLFLGTGGLRPGEAFGTQRLCTRVVLPSQHAYFGLPYRVGFVEADFVDETKTQPHKNSDMILLYHTASGLSPGKWTN